MKFFVFAALAAMSFSAFANRPFKDCGLKSNGTIVFVSPNGTIKQYTWLPSELRDIDLYDQVKNGTYICVEGELNERDILSAKRVE